LLTFTNQSEVGKSKEDFEEQAIPGVTEWKETEYKDLWEQRMMR
jgi:hypothetical protein